MKKIYLLFSLIGSINILFGQTNIWYISAENATKTLSVDTEDAIDGSLGSWYKWEINNNATILATGNDVDGPDDHDNNEALITWNATFPNAYVENNTNELIKDFQIKATELNNCDNTIGNSTNTDVKLVKLDILKVELDSEICNDNEGYITIYGTPEATVTIQLSGGQLVNATPILIGNDGKVNIPVKPTANSLEIIVQITEIRFSKDNPFNQQFSIVKNNDFTFDTNNMRIKVGKSPVISPIKF